MRVSAPNSLARGGLGWWVWTVGSCLGQALEASECCSGLGQEEDKGGKEVWNMEKQKMGRSVCVIVRYGVLVCEDNECKVLYSVRRARFVSTWWQHKKRIAGSRARIGLLIFLGPFGLPRFRLSAFFVLLKLCRLFELYWLWSSLPACFVRSDLWRKKCGSDSQIGAANGEPGKKV